MRLHVIASPVAGVPEFENITLLDDWSKIKDVINSMPEEANWKGEREIRNLYTPKICVNMLLDGINKYGFE